MRFNTALLHGDFRGDKNTGATQTPIYQSSAFEHASAETLEKIFNNMAPGFSYSRISNPTIEAFEKRMTVLEGGVASVACSSGMAAITNAFTNILQSGDEIVCSASLYGGSIDLFRDLESFGIKTHYVNNNDVEQFRAATNENTRLYFAETIGNPRLDVTDIRLIADEAHRAGVPFIVDNSTSKYVNGNSNSISGVITDSGNFKWDIIKYPGMKDFKKYGPYAYTAKLRNGIYRNTGACLSPQNAFYNILGMETLGIRMERVCSNSMTLAKYLNDNYGNLSVNYPGLENSEFYDIAKKELNNGFGGIITIRTGSKEKAFKFINALKIPLNVSNIGDTKTLVIHPSSTISAHSTEEEKKIAGVYDDLVRISVGIEDVQDLIEDFTQALKAAN